MTAVSHAQRRSEKTAEESRLLTPLDRAIVLLNEVKMMSTDDEMVDMLDLALECLTDQSSMNDPKALQAAVEEEDQMPGTLARNAAEAGAAGGGRLEDPETKEWLRANFVDQPQFYGSKAKRSLKSVVQSVMTSLWLVKLSGKNSTSDVALPPNLDLALAQRERLVEVLANLHEWEFDVFAVHSLCGAPLQVCTFAMLKSSTIMASLPIDEGRLVRFLRELERGYQDNPYHTSTHGADVMQTLMYFLGRGELALHMNPLEVLASLVAAAAHDVNHDGHNNNFHIVTTTQHALTHNNKAVLENHSARVVFELLARDECNFLARFDRRQFLIFRDHVIDLILGTDMSQHFAVMGQVKTKIAAANGDLAVKTEDMGLYTKLAIKCADVSNPAKPRETYLRWADRIMEEFFRQGDREKELGLPVSPFMDRATTQVSKCQIGFIDFIVLPLYQACSAFLEEMSTPLAHIEGNLKYFKKILEKENAAKEKLQQN